MTSYRIEPGSASFRWKWRCAQILPALPSPGTPPFAKLIAALQPFGVDARGITFEAPGARLSDVSLNLALWRGPRLQITCEGFEVIDEPFLDEHLSLLPKLVGIAHLAIRECSPDGPSGRYQITYSAHLGLAPGKAGLILGAHLSSKEGDQELAPDAFAYTLQPAARSDVVEMRLVIAKSLRLPEGVYVELMAVYRGELSPEDLALCARRDSLDALARFGLENEPGGAI